MTLKENNPKSAIATSIHVFLGEMAAGEKMSLTFEDLGTIDEESLTITTAEGATIELKDINGELTEYMRRQPTVTVAFALQKPSEKTRGKFWELREVGEGENRKVQVVSLIKNKYMSLKFANIEDIGSETFEAPKCSISMNMEYAGNKGYTGVCSAMVMKAHRTDGIKPELFQFGVVAPLVPALEVTPTSLSFGATADATGQTLTATSTGNVTSAKVPSTIEWAIVTKTGKTAKVKVLANANSEARTCIVTIVADGSAKDILITQSGV